MNADASELPPERPSVAPNGPGRKGAVAVAASALAGGASVKDAAAQAGIGRRTLSRWLAVPKFRARVEALRTEAVSVASNKLTTAMSAAVDTLLLLLEGGRSDVRLRAARTILEVGMKLKEHVEIVQRVSDLEQRLANPPPVYRGPPPNQTKADVM